MNADIINATENDVKKANAVLEIKRKIVGVKLVQTRETFAAYAAIELAAPLAYCVAVKCAMAGASIKLTAQTSGCFGSSRALGMQKPESDFYDGSEGCMLGLFPNQSVAQSVAEKMLMNETPIYGVVVKPLELFEKAPDIVLMVTDPKNIMRIIQGYTYAYGMQPNFNMTGNQAVCVECTTFPLKTHTINISMLCSGTRYHAKWKNTEAMVGIPFNLFSNVIKGVCQTVNPVEMNDRKHVIEEKLQAAGFFDMEIIYDKTYYTEFEKEAKIKRKNERASRQKGQ